MRILFVYDALYPDRTGGVEHRNRELARRLASRGHDAALAGWASNCPSTPPEVELLELPHATELYSSDGKRRAWAALQFGRAVSNIDVGSWDVIETANIPYAHLWPLWLKTRSTRTKLVVTWHEFMGSAWAEYQTRWNAPFFSAVERQAASIGDIRVAVSEFTRDRLLQAADPGATEIPIVPNGIPGDRLEAVRREFGTAYGKGPVFVFAGRLHANKRVHLVMEGLAEMEFERAKPWFRVIGDGPVRGRLEKRAAQLGLEDVVEFTGEFEAVEDVWRQMAECDFAVQPSSREGFGMFPLEAMALGLPIIFWRSEASAVSEVVQNGTGGIQVNGVRDLRKGLNQLVKCYGHFRQSALKRSEQYHWKEIVRKFEQEVAST